ncbi:hypothetical protein C8R48DRAFT_673556 [Suillus tomentosus]|nr:hypothetical protein C8R48DRAFT_673556 [Suillus tomentosus]
MHLPSVVAVAFALMALVSATPLNIDSSGKCPKFPSFSVFKTDDCMTRKRFNYVCTGPLEYVTTLLNGGLSRKLSLSNCESSRSRNLKLHQAGASDPCTSNHGRLDNENIVDLRMEDYMVVIKAIKKKYPAQSTGRLMFVSA